MADLNQPESLLPDQIHWKSRGGDDPSRAEAEPTFPEGAWTDSTATVEAVLEPGRRYQVRFEGSYWTALPVTPGARFTVGDRVTLLGREDNALIIGAIPGG